MSSDICSICQIQNINPIHQVVKPLFIGVLNKNKKNHSITLQFDTKLIQNSKFKIEIRSIRLKEKIQRQILFPDAASIIVNN